MHAAANAPSMAIAGEKSALDGKVWGFFKLSFRQSASGGNRTTSSSTSSSRSLSDVEGSKHQRPRSSVSSVAKSLLLDRRRLKLDPANKLYFPYEPRKQVRSAIRIKNTSKSYVAFKFQTTSPKSCFMRPPGAILAPGESLIATVFKFVEHPEKNEKPMDQKNMVKFKIMSLKLKGPVDYLPELFDEQKDQVVIEQILQAVFLDPERPCSALEKLKQQLADADAEVEARKKPLEDPCSKFIGEGLIINEWRAKRKIPYSTAG